MRIYNFRAEYIQYISLSLRYIYHNYYETTLHTTATGME